MGSLAEHKADLARRREAFPDARFEIEDLLADGDRVAVRYTMTGTHGGAFMGIAPSGRKVSRASMAVFRIARGKIAEGWVIADQSGLMQQLRGE